MKKNKEKLVHREKKRRAIETNRPVPTLHSSNGLGFLSIKTKQKWPKKKEKKKRNI